MQSVGAEIDQPIRDRIAAGEIPGGADLIKLFATTRMSAGGNQSMSDEQIQAACGEARALGLRTRSSSTAFAKPTTNPWMPW